MFAGWGYDFLKLDGVGPGSFKGAGDNYNNVADVAAWQRAMQDAGRPIHLDCPGRSPPATPTTGSSTPTAGASTPTSSATATPWSRWENSVDDRWGDAPAWTDDAGPGGWNDLDSLDVGNGEMDGLNKAERQSYMTLWAINERPCSPATTSPSSTPTA